MPTLHHLRCPQLYELLDVVVVTVTRGQVCTIHVWLGGEAQLLRIVELVTLLPLCGAEAADQVDVVREAVEAAEGGVSNGDLVHEDDGWMLRSSGRYQLLQMLHRSDCLKPLTK